MRANTYNRFMNIAHRGFSGAQPENTLASFKAAVEMGIEFIECDVRFTNDRHIVVIHDRTVDRTTNGSGLVSDFSLAELKQLDAGSWFSEDSAGERIPTLQETLTTVAGSAELVVEIKDSVYFPPIVEEVVNLVKSGGFVETVNVSAFHWDVLTRVKELEPNLKTSALIMFNSESFDEFEEVDGALVKVYTHTEELINDASRSNVDIVCPPARAITRSMVEQLHEAGFLVRAWGVNGKNMEEMSYLVSCGVDGMTTNYPHLLACLLEQQEV